MKLSSVDYYLDWPVSIKLKNLREFVIEKLDKVFQTILKAATYEFMYKPNLSINIIIKEYLNSSNFLS